MQHYNGLTGNPVTLALIAIAAVKTVCTHLFPQAQPTSVPLCVAQGTAVREMTLARGRNYLATWVFKAHMEPSQSVLCEKLLSVACTSANMLAWCGPEHVQRQRVQVPTHKFPRGTDLMWHLVLAQAGSAYAAVRDLCAKQRVHHSPGCRSCLAYS